MHQVVSRLAAATAASAIVLVIFASAVSADAARPSRMRGPSIVNGHAPTSWVGQSVAIVTWESADRTSSFLCSGTLIATNWVLTAGHCAADETTGAPLDPAGYAVAVGDASVTNRPDWGGIDRVEVNPGYQGTGSDWDAALLHLSGAGSAEPTVDLLDPADAGAGAPNAPAKALGWGVTDSVTQALPDRLQETEMQIGDPTWCATALPPGVFTANQVCATAKPGTTCSGDSGGPLLVSTPDGYPFLDGVTDYALPGCPTASPAGFASAAAIRPWVMTTAGLQAPRVVSVTRAVAETHVSVTASVQNFGADSHVVVAYWPSGLGVAPQWSPDTWVSGARTTVASLPITGLRAGTSYNAAVSVWSSYGTAYHPFAFTTPDRSAPSLTAYAVRGRLGKRVHLTWRVTDNSGVAGMTVSMYRGRRRISRASAWLKLSGSPYWYLVWKLPKKAGSYHWCVEARDHSGNASPQRCAAIKTSGAASVAPARHAKRVWLRGS